MPRPRTGLGQGLEALVPPLRETSTIAAIGRATAAPVAWEVASLKRLRNRRCIFTIAPGGLLQKTKRQRLKASSLLALGALAASGWELVALSGDTFYLKRPASADPN